MNKQVWIKKKIAEERIKKICPNIENKSGIYMWYRNAEIKCYIGQAKGRLLDRSIDLLLQYDHLGNSIRNHGLFSKDNPTGWKLVFYYCDDDQLNDKEREEIAKYRNLGYTLYNITSGGQNEGKVDINQRQASKGYQEGLHKGYEKCKREIQVLFEKYLVAEIKEKPNKIKERKLKEFKEWLNGETI